MEMYDLGFTDSQIQVENNAMHDIWNEERTDSKSSDEAIPQHQVTIDMFIEDSYLEAWFLLQVE